MASISWETWILLKVTQVAKLNLTANRQLKSGLYPIVFWLKDWGLLCQPRCCCTGRSLSCLTFGESLHLTAQSSA